MFSRVRNLTTAAAFVAALVLIPAAARAQRFPVGGLGGEHEIYGEVKIEESKAKEKVPGSFMLVLTANQGKAFARYSVMNNSTYRFMGLRNGTYEIVVESAGMAVARIQVVLDSSRKVEVRQDIMLEWVGGGGGTAKPGAVSTAEFYERGAATGEIFGRAEAAYKKKKYKDALPLFQQIVAADERDHIAWAYLGSAQSSLGNAAEAEDSYKRALALKPELLAAAVNLGRLYTLNKNFDKAVEVLKPAVDKHPDSADAHFLLAEAYLQTGKYDESAAHFRDALRLDPKGKAEAHLRLAALLSAAGKKEEAAAELKLFIEKNPNHPNREKFEEYIRQNRKR
jgi:Flp pilus assembly protein TadD